MKERLIFLLGNVALLILRFFAMYILGEVVLLISSPRISIGFRFVVVDAPLCLNRVSLELSLLSWSGRRRELSRR